MWGGIGLAAALLIAAPFAAQAEKVLKVVPHADLRIVDPYATTATITLMHGQMIYDQLFGWDAKLVPKPQMVEQYEVSPDRLVYTFTLRPGLKFHDGQKVTTRDVIASIKMGCALTSTLSITGGSRSEGRLMRAAFTAWVTSLAAESMSVPSLNCTTMVAAPSTAVALTLSRWRIV